MSENNIEAKTLKQLNIISVIIPIAVALMLGIRSKIYLGEWTKILPHIIGLINTITAIVLLIGLYFIKVKQIESHRKAMSLAFLLGFLFLICYITYHISNPSTHFGGEGAIRYLYYFVLISHIGLSLVVLPFVLRAMYFARIGQFDKHRKVVRFAYPFWFYVSVTGVIAYLMINPYY